MKYRLLKRAWIELSEISFGCMSLETDRTLNNRLLAAAFDGGINYFDTADIYQNGLNEEMVGEAIQPFRKEIYLATKVGNQPKPDGSGWDWNPSKSYIIEAVEKSLKRLKTDYIDIYQLHGGTIEDNREEVVEAFELLQEQGKILHYGFSSIRPNVIKAFAQNTQAVSNMLQYSLLDRRPEEEVLNLLQQHEVGVLVRGAIAKGFLIDKESSDYLNYTSKDVDLMRDKVESFSIEKIKPLQVILQWVLRQKSVTSLVLGMRTEAQLQEALCYKDVEVEDSTIFDQLSQVLEPNVYTSHRN